LDCLPLGGVEVSFYGEAVIIKLTASSKNVLIGGNSTITATVYDSKGTIVLNYDDSKIDFYKDGIFFSQNNFNNGEAIITVSSDNFNNGEAIITVSSDSADTVTITASSDGLDCLPLGGVEVNFYEKTTIKLVEDSAIYYPADLKVAFEVVAIGENILVEGMGISWEPNTAKERLQKIIIKSEEVYEEVYTGNSLSGANLDITDTILSDGVTYLVELTFGKDVPEKIFKVIFYTPTSPGMFSLENIRPVPEPTP